MGCYFDEPNSKESAPLTIQSVNKMMASIYEKQIMPNITIMGPGQYKRMRFFQEKILQDPMWNKIGRNILPWIPTTQRRFRVRRRKIREGLAEFLLDRGIIEIPSHWEW